MSGLVIIGGLLDVVYSAMLSEAELTFVIKPEDWLPSSVFPFEVGKVAPSPSSDTPSLLLVKSSGAPDSFFAVTEGLVMAIE